MIELEGENALRNRGVRTLLLLCLSLALPLTSCRQISGKVPVEVSNLGPTPLTDLSLIASHSQEHLQALPGNSTATILMDGDGGSGLVLVFRGQGGKEYRKDLPVYFESHSRGSIKIWIDRNSQVTCKDATSP